MGLRGDRMSGNAKRTRIATVLRRCSWLLGVLTVITWIALGFSHLVQWSTFTAGSVRPHVPRVGGPGPLPGTTLREEREETHYMFGSGGMFISGNVVNSGSFASSGADLNSEALAWATIDDLVPRWLAWRWYWNGPYRIVGIRFMPLAIVFSLLLVGCIGLRRGQVPEGLCGRCRYDLRGIEKGERSEVTCPECGCVDD